MPGVLVEVVMRENILVLARGQAPPAVATLCDETEVGGKDGGEGFIDLRI